MRYGCSCDSWIGKVTRKEDEGDISSVFCVAKIGKVADFQRRITIGIEHLRGVLYRWLASCINKFLQVRSGLRKHIKSRDL